MIEESVKDLPAALDLVAVDSLEVVMAKACCRSLVVDPLTILIALVISFQVGCLT